jgi:hypothetical protein
LEGDGFVIYKRHIASTCPKAGNDSRGNIERAGDAGIVRVVLVDLRLDHGMSRPSIAEVKVVQRVAGVGGNPSLIVGRGTRALGLAEGGGLRK